MTAIANHSRDRYEPLIRNFVHWANSRFDVRAALIIGSQARVDHPADEWSDLDILIFVQDPDAFIREEDWYRQIGGVVLSFVERTTGGEWERRVLFEGGLDVDFALNPVTHLHYLLHAAIPPDAADVFRRGTRILVDKDGLLALVQERPLPAAADYQPPLEREYLNVVHDFWYHALWTARHLRRGELWWAKCGCDIRLKELLRQMLEWHAHATKGAQYDTWLRGRFLEEWADHRAVRELPHVFAYYNYQDIRRALLETMQLFHWVALETAAQWHYFYPSDGEKTVKAMVQEVLEKPELAAEVHT